MGRPLSLFSDYRGGENHTTNFCGLILKLLYQDNPRAFSTLLAEITGSPVEIGVQFVQQERGELSVPDLAIRQQAMEIFVETKPAENQFRDEQLRAHLGSFREEAGRRVLLGMSRFDSDAYREEFLAKHQAVAKAAGKVGVTLAALSFDEFLDRLRAAETTPAFKAYLGDFADYLDRHNCLSTWRTLLDVVNVGQTFEEFLEQGAYFCAEGPAQYSHRNAFFIGAYQSMAVKSIAELVGVVALPFGGEPMRVLRNPRGLKKSDLIDRATASWSQVHGRRKEQSETMALKMFVLGPRHATDFRKDTPGGLQGSKIYFDGIARKVGASTAQELADKLSGQVWSNFR